MNKLTHVRWLAISALLIGTSAVAQTTSTDTAPAMRSSSDTAPADNSKSNRLDPSNRSASADKQKNDTTDLDLVKQIRQSVMADKGLSTYGHNVKIVAVNGTVTLNGVVRTADEKAQIGRKAAAIAGAGHVVDDLKVASAE